MGPVEAPLALIRGRYRFRLLFLLSFLGQRSFDIQSFIRAMFAAAPKCLVLFGLGLTWTSIFSKQYPLAGRFALKVPFKRKELVGYF